MLHTVQDWIDGCLDRGYGDLMNERARLLHLQGMYDGDKPYDHVCSKMKDIRWQGNCRPQQMSLGARSQLGLQTQEFMGWVAHPNPMIQSKIPPALFGPIENLMVRQKLIANEISEELETQGHSPVQFPAIDPRAWRMLNERLYAP